MHETAMRTNTTVHEPPGRLAEYPLHSDTDRSVEATNPPRVVAVSRYGRLAPNLRPPRSLSLPGKNQNKRSGARHLQLDAALGLFRSRSRSAERPTTERAARDDQQHQGTDHAADQAGGVEVGHAVVRDQAH